jgi:Kef-type K+ transport system membrane component KefB
MHAELSSLLLSLVTILIAAKIGGEIAERCKQPAVLGELIIGCLLGNLYLFDFLHHSTTLKYLSELGVILLLFEIGLETTIAEIFAVGLSASLVAVLGVIAPFILGWGVSYLFLPEANYLIHAFIGATLCATSVGITARVLKDLNATNRKESKIILGAAVIDDILGLLVLAVVAGIITSANTGATFGASAVFIKIATAIGFLVASLFLGKTISPKLFALATQLNTHGVLQALSLALCFGLAYLAELSGLAPIVGAFAAGLILEPVHYRELAEKNEIQEIDHIIKPLTSLFVPIFFVTMGAAVDIKAFFDAKIIGFAVALSLVAIIGKQICALGVVEKSDGKEKTDRLLVGLGMIPRGEVGLIFASIGASLTLHGQAVIDRTTFVAVVFMVMATTMITPPLLKWRISQPPKNIKN